MIKVEIDEGSGFCFGVVTAIHKAEEELAKGETLYCLGDIVHNSREVDRLKTMGLITINREEFKLNLEELKINRKQKLSSVSYGQQKKAMLAYAFALHTPYILLDEPTNGLDITSRQALKRIISRSMDDESTLLISTHQAHDFENLLDHLVILGKGEILLNRSLDEISNRLLFARTDILPAESIYSEQDLSGHFSILPNEDGEENTPDIELLYKAVLQQPEKIKSMFQ